MRFNILNDDETKNGYPKFCFSFMYYRIHKILSKIILHEASKGLANLESVHSEKNIVKDFVTFF